MRIEFTKTPDFNRLILGNKIIDLSDSELEQLKKILAVKNKFNQNKVRSMVANYIGSEGCSCCEGSYHKEHGRKLAEALLVEKYEDGSGYNWGMYETNE